MRAGDDDDKEYYVMKYVSAGRETIVIDVRVKGQWYCSQDNFVQVGGPYDATGLLAKLMELRDG